MSDILKVRPAIDAACRFIESDVVPRRCDSDGVSNCIRCTSVAIARWLQEAVRELEAARTNASPALPREEK